MPKMKVVFMVMGGVDCEPMPILEKMMKIIYIDEKMYYKTMKMTI